MAKPIIAVQLYTLRNFLKTPEDVAETFRKVKELGYNAVQVSGMGPVDPEFVKEVADREGLTICATHVAFERLQNDMEAVIREHKLWNCKYVGVGSMPQQYREDKEGFVRFAKEASEYGRVLKENGLILIYHNHNFEFRKFDGRLGMDILFEESDERYLQFEIDTYWVQSGGSDPVAWIKKMGGRMDVVHYKDMALGNKSEQIMAEVGEGNLNWKDIIAVCEEIGAKWCAVEQDVCQRDPFESLAMSKKNLESYGCQF